MNIYILGMPKSGRTTIAKSICQNINNVYVHSSSWLKLTFREQMSNELIHHYNDEYHNYISDRLIKDPDLISNYVFNVIDDHLLNNNFVIDGLFSPKDFISLFDYNKDIVIFLNRINNNAEYKDYENIGFSVIKDYCFWLSSAGLLPKKSWIEYNFQIPGYQSNDIKILGSKNNIYIVKSFDKAVEHINRLLIDDFNIDQIDR